MKASRCLFEHNLYVLECGDGSFYTGYATDVQARLKAHQSGKGAKYTKSHAPVQLIAQARFYSKSRAMSAEAHFKKLDRAQKEELLKRAEVEPFEKVLCSVLPGFSEETAQEFVCRSIYENRDLEYRYFHSKLVPNINVGKIVGVRTPALRKIAKELSKRKDAINFLEELPHKTFDENQVHAFTIGLEKNYDKAIELYENFLPHIDNWATCDQLPVKVLAKDPARTLQKVNEWIQSDYCYTIRFGIGVLMRLFLDELFEEEFLNIVAKAHMPDSNESPALEDDIYYGNMMRAWYFAEALAKQESFALPYFEQRGGDALLDEWTRRKAIQKAIESRRINAELKELLRSFKESSAKS